MSKRNRKKGKNEQLNPLLLEVLDKVNKMTPEEYSKEYMKLLPTMKEIEKKEEENSKLLNNEDNVIPEYTRIYRCIKCKKEVSFWNSLCDDCLYNNKTKIFDINNPYFYYSSLVSYLIIIIMLIMFAYENNQQKNEIITLKKVISILKGENK